MVKNIKIDLLDKIKQLLCDYAVRGINPSLKNFNKVIGNLELALEEIESLKTRNRKLLKQLQKAKGKRNNYGLF